MAVPDGLLRAPTDPAWFGAAVERVDELLIDHANCEKKAASTALSIMFAYPEDFDLADRMSRLAREELRHFELVQQKITQLGVEFRRLSPARYADGLRRADKRGPDAASRLDQLAAVEAELATSPDARFRFHSGTPIGGG